MKMLSHQSVHTDCWIFCAGDGKQDSFMLFDSIHERPLVRFRWCEYNHLSEKEAIQEEFRFHERKDGTEIDCESVSVFPFGGEAEITRNFALRDGWLECCTDVKPGAGEAVRSFALEEISFPGKWSKIEIASTLPDPGQPWAFQSLDLSAELLWSADHAPAIVLLTDEEGFQIEIGSGSDWWRVNPDVPENRAEWALRKTADGLEFCRQVINFPDPEYVVERRPWRFNFYLAWGELKDTASVPEGGVTVDLPALPEACRRAPAVRKLLRKALRRAVEQGSGPMLLALDAPQVCDSAAHLERPGKVKLRHWDMDELFALYAWGNRLRSERPLVILLPEDSCFRTMPSGRRLAAVPRHVALSE